MKCWEMIKVVE